MKTVLMAVAVITRPGQVLIRKFDPAHNPYTEPWGLFGGRLEGDDDIPTALNRELQERWNMTVTIVEDIGWAEEVKADHDGERKRFAYLNALCELAEGTPHSKNSDEELKWVDIDQLSEYTFNPLSAKLLKKIGYLL